MKKSGYIILALIIIAGSFGIAIAMPSYLTGFSSAYPDVPGVLSTCNLCHVSTSPPSFNPYGTAYLNGAHNFQAIENLDSDGDGFNNIDELNAGTFPGDASSKPAPPQPPAGTGLLEVPVNQTHNFYPSSVSPVISNDPAQSRPVAVGAAAEGGNVLDLRVAFGGFSGDVDIYFAMGISEDPENLYFLMSDYSVQAVSIEDIITAAASGNFPIGPWKADISGPIDETLLSGFSVSNIPAGTYTFYALVTTPGSIQDFYLWTSEFTRQGVDGTVLYAQNCSACHGLLDISSKRGASAGRIQAAIDANTGGMGSLAFLSPGDVQAIADVLLQQAAVIEAPKSQMGFSYPAIEMPVLHSDASSARPLGLGPIASGGEVLTLRAGLGEFVSPVDLYLAIRSSSDSSNMYFLGSDYTVESVPFFLALKLLSSGSLPPMVEPWKLNTMGPVDEIIVDNLSISNIAPGTYYLYLMATPANSLQHYYIWNYSVYNRGRRCGFGWSCAIFPKLRIVPRDACQLDEDRQDGKPDPKCDQWQHRRYGRHQSDECADPGDSRRSWTADTATSADDNRRRYTICQ